MMNNNSFEFALEEATPVSELSQISANSPFADSFGNHLVVIDSAVDHIEQLTARLERSRILILNSSQNGISQITDALAQYTDSALDGLHIISHADTGVLQLGSNSLNAEGLSKHADALTDWGKALSSNGDILLYGCNLAEGDTGEYFISQLSQLTGADVAASNDLTGSSGDWILEANTGSIEAQVILDTTTQNSYQGTLASYNGKEYVLTRNKTWEAAQAEARSLGGNLVTINNAAEENWIRQTFGRNEGFWIGLSDKDQEGTFKWVNGEALTYTNWAPNEPNDFQGTQDYGRINFGSTRQWDDEHSYTEFKGIVEIDSPTTPTPNPPPVTPTPNPGNNSPTYNGSRYQLTSAKTWEEAQSEARSLGGNLVTINNAAEENWIKQTFGNSEGFWMGLSDKNQEGTFKWASGEALTYTNWAPGEPNDFGGGQDYGRINFSNSRQWDDEYAFTKLRGIIEIKLGTPNPPTPTPPTPTPPTNNSPTYNGSRYQLTSAKTWEEAQAEARSLGGNLVTINNVAEENWIKQTFGNNKGFWMGLTDKNQEGTFQWASGEALTYTNWAPGEPNDFGGRQDYGRINFGSNRQWDDEYAFSKYQGIVEIKLGTTPNPPVPPTPPTPPTNNLPTYNGSRYQLTSAKTWEAAQSEARRLGGNLVTINNAAEENWIKQTFGNSEGFWMGLTDKSQEGTFKWASGEALTYTNWAPGEPNDFGGGQDYGRINFSNSRQWDDEYAFTKLRGIIEIGSNAPTTPPVTPPVTTPTTPPVTPPTNPPTTPPDYSNVFTRIVPVDYSGYNTDAVELDDWSNVSLVSALGNAAKGVGAQTLRLPGGDGGNYWDWDLGSIIQERQPFTQPFNLIQDLPLSLHYQYNKQATLNNVKPLITNSGAEPIWVVNMNTSSLDKEIRHLIEAQNIGLNVNRIELGNELFFGLPNYTRAGNSLETAAAYAAKAKAWALAIKSTPQLANATVAVTGIVASSILDQRGQEWWPALTRKTGSDNRSAVDVVDAFTIHPYYSTNDLNIRKSDVGNRGRAGQIARDGIDRLRGILAGPELDQAALQNKQLWVTEHNVIEDSTVVLGNSWVHALMMDLHTHEFLRDERTTVSVAHVLTGNPQWQALTNEDGSQIDGSQRGRADRPFVSRGNEQFQQTAIGLVLGETAEVFDSGTAALLKSAPAFIAWRVTNSVDNISAVNADDRSETLVLPGGRNWEVRTYTGDPWKTVKRESDLTVTTRTFAGGSTLTIPGFSKVVATAK